jgi:hypothetical protein
MFLINLAKEVIARTPDFPEALIGKHCYWNSIKNVLMYSEHQNTWLVQFWMVENMSELQMVLFFQDRLISESVLECRNIFIRNPDKIWMQNPGLNLETPIRKPDHSNTKHKICLKIHMFRIRAFGRSL